MKKDEEALLYFADSFNCSQSVFTVFGKACGLEEDVCLKIATPFGAGMGRQQLTCGAVTGALMAIGLHFGRAAGDDVSKRLETYAKTNEFFVEFTRLHGTAECRALLGGLNMNDPADHQKIVDMNLFRTVCDKCVRDAVLIVESLIG